MRKLLNVLYITTPDAYLAKDGMNVVVTVEGQERFRIPAVNIEGIVTFGRMGASPGLMRLCADSGIALTFLSPYGKYIGRVQGPTQGNVLLRRAQYRLADEPQEALHIARLIVAAKIHNYRQALRRFVRDYGPDAEAEAAAASLDHSKRHALQADDTAELMGHEGQASNTWFASFPKLLVAENHGFTFAGRNRRPPKDAINAMLSFAYTLIAADTTAALETVGLDPYVGVLHAMRPGRASLALDITEEFRAYLGDRLVISLINRRQITPADFMPQGDQGIVMTDKGRKTFLTAWQARKRETITHPYLGEKVEIGLLPYVQAMMLARYIRGDIDDYPVFITK